MSQKRYTTEQIIGILSQTQKPQSILRVLLNEDLPRTAARLTISATVYSSWVGARARKFFSKALSEDTL